MLIYVILTLYNPSIQQNLIDDSEQQISKEYILSSINCVTDIMIK